MVFLISLDGMASRDDCSVQPCHAILDPLVATSTVGQIMPWIWRGNYNSGMCWYSIFVCIYEFVYAICGLFSTNVLFIYTVLFTSLSRVEADRVYGVILRAKLSTIDLTSWRRSALFWTAVIFCAYTSMYALSIRYETSVRDYHRLRGSASPVLTATGFVNGRWQFSTPHRINTPWPITKKLVQMITSAARTAAPNLVQIRRWGASGQMGEI